MLPVYPYCTYRTQVSLTLFSKPQKLEQLPVLHAAALHSTISSATTQQLTPSQQDLAIRPQLPSSKEYSMSHGRRTQTGNMVRFSTGPLAPPLPLSRFTRIPPVPLIFFVSTVFGLTPPYYTTRACHLPLSPQCQ